MKLLKMGGVVDHDNTPWEGIVALSEDLMEEGRKKKIRKV